MLTCFYQKPGRNVARVGRSVETRQWGSNGARDCALAASKRFKPREDSARQARQARLARLARQAMLEGLGGSGALGRRESQTASGGLEELEVQARQAELEEPGGLARSAT